MMSKKQPSLVKYEQALEREKPICKVCGSDKPDEISITLHGIKIEVELTCKVCGAEWVDVYEFQRSNEVNHA